jgi:hypothetical protein
MPLVIAGATSGSTTVQATDAVTATITLPSATDTLVGKATTDTLTNKTLTLPVVGTTIGVGGATPSASGAGITFPATQSASTNANTLDDYEEGTWTPSLTFGGGSTGLTYTNREGWYTKVGNMVSVQCNIFLSNTGSSNGIAAVSGLPFALSSSNFKRNGAYAFADRITPSQVLPVANTATFEISTLSTGTASSAANLVRTDFANNTYLSYSFTYFI